MLPFGVINRLIDRLMQLCKKSEDDKDDLIDDVVTDSGKLINVFAPVTF